MTESKSIRYSETKEFRASDLQTLFLSVQWSSGNFPEPLRVAMANSHRVVSAWDGERLVGLMNALSDTTMTAYFHYLLVHPEYHDQGIGRALVANMLQFYQDFPRKVLIAYEGEVEFYKHCGFEVGEGKIPLFVTTLTT